MQWGRARENDMEDFKIMRRNSKQQTKYMKNISAENIPHSKCWVHGPVIMNTLPCILVSVTYTCSQSRHIHTKLVMILVHKSFFVLNSSGELQRKE